MKKEEKIKLLQEQIDELEKFPQGDFLVTLTPKFKKWLRDTEVIIENLFGNNARHISDFKYIEFCSIDRDDNYKNKLFTISLFYAKAILTSMKEEIEKFDNTNECEISEAQNKQLEEKIKYLYIPLLKSLIMIIIVLLVIVLILVFPNVFADLWKKIISLIISAGGLWAFCNFAINLWKLKKEIKK